jgi:hypothetical protein
MTFEEYNLRRAEVLTMWSRLFDICRLTIAGVESGQVKLNASMLKEFSNFLKLSLEVLDVSLESTRSNPAILRT